MRGIRLKLSVYEKKILTAVLHKESQDEGNELKAQACGRILKQIEEKTRQKYYDARKRK